MINLRVQYQLCMFNKLRPYVTVTDLESDPPRSFRVGTTHMPTPQTAQEAVRQALHAYSRLFERVIGDPTIPAHVFNEKFLAHRRKGRAFVNALRDEDLSHVELEFLPSILEPPAWYRQPS